jgi:CBS domain-containing protein
MTSIRHIAFVAWLVSLCTCAAVPQSSTSPSAGTPAPIADPPRRPDKPLVLIVMPDSESFRAVRRALVNEVKKDLDVATHIINARSTPSEFIADLETSGAACVVLMDNPTVKLYRAYQKSRKGPAGSAPKPLVPAVVVMASFLEDLRAELINASGVAYEVPGVTAFVQLRSVIKKPVRRVGVIYRPAFAPFLERQEALAAKEQITVVPIRVPVDASASDVREALKGLRLVGDIDALWVLNDNGLLRGAEFLESAWRPEIAALGVPVVVSVPTLVSAEARFGTFAVLPDLDALGIQAANVLLEVADSDWRADGHPVELPISTLTVVNMRQVRLKFGLRDGALRRIDRVIE